MNSFLIFALSVCGVVLSLFIIYALSKLSRGWCRSQACLVGKTVIVTGANVGLGFETALDFAKRGAKVILACRNEEKAKQAVEKIIQQTNNKNVTYGLLDFNSLASVKEFAAEINRSEDRLDILVNNAGLGSLNGRSQDGLNALMQCNYYGPFLLTVLLLDLLKKTPSSRIVNVGSLASILATVDLETLDKKEGWWPGHAYSRTKLCNIMFTIELARRLQGTSVTTYSLHPGSVDTNLFRDMPKFFKVFLDYMCLHYFKSPLEGAQTTLYCALEQGIEKHSGQNFSECKLRWRYSTVAYHLWRDPQYPEKLWKKTEQLLGLSY